MNTPPLDWTDPVTRLFGVTAKRATAFRRLGVETVDDLMRLAPRRYEDRRNPTPIGSLEPGVTAIVIGEVVHSKSFRARRGLSILEALVRDDSGEVLARWFHRGFVASPLAAGRRVALYGAPQGKTGRLEFQAPALERLAPEADGPDANPGAERLVPIHPATSGLTPPVIRRAIWNALTIDAPFPDPLPEALLRSVELPTLDVALRVLHFPDSEDAAEIARRRLAFDELLVHELLIARRRARVKSGRSHPFALSARVHERIRSRIPFTLTDGQAAAVSEIVADLEQPVPMNRLLQGDVGSGKTAVAAYAMLGAIATGVQCALMAPTEVLARQHLKTFRAMLTGSRVRIALLTGGRSKARVETARRIADGEVDLVIGTHAVLSDDVAFSRLGLVVVDEQHKFGVRQRRRLLQKGAEGPTHRPHQLVMTATPIPRTLALVMYGDLDVSVIEGRPPGRKPVETQVAKPKEGRAVFRHVQAAIAKGEQAYVIYPLVEESDKVGLKDAVAGAARWQRALPDHRVGLLHGRMKRDEKETIMQAFRERDVDVLVSTVVIEVGVDVPNATVLVVEHAERFGLSQLHQLRGRIGRGEAGGLCVLMDRSAKGTPARLSVLAKTDDGFVIAEEDLKLRGLGDLAGTRQHGLPAFRAASLPEDLPLLQQARGAARRLSADPGPSGNVLDGPLGDAVRRREAWLEAREQCTI